MLGGFGVAYDLVASEYGYTDEQIHELPLARLHQITAAIQVRRFIRSREENARTSWLARNLAGFIAAGYMVDSKKENPGIKAAQDLAYDDIEAAQLADSRLRAEREQQQDPARGNTEGSFERLMRGLPRG